MRIARVVLVVAFQLVVAGRAPVAWACSCAAMTDQEHFESADVVFEGTVVGREEPRDDRSGTGSIVWTFHVEGIHKGDAAEQQAVRSATQSAMCGYQFAMAQRYQVFARAAEGGLTTGLCDGNRHLAGGSGPYAAPGVTPRSPRPAATRAPSPRATPPPTRATATATVSAATPTPTPTSSGLAAPSRPAGRGGGIAAAAALGGLLAAGAGVIAWRRVRSRPVR